MNRTEAEGCVAAAIAVFEGYTQPSIDPEVIAEHNACAAAVVAALFDLHGQTQWGHGAPHAPVLFSDDEAHARRSAEFWHGYVVSRRVLPSIETEWEPAT